MTNDASRMMAQSLKSLSLNESFSPAQMGARMGLSEPQANAAARELSNAGVLVLGFDNAAQFSPEFRKAYAKSHKKPARRKSAVAVRA